MIDHRLRNERILKESLDPEVAVILLDVVRVHGAHADPAAEMVPVIAAASRIARPASLRSVRASPAPRLPASARRSWRSTGNSARRAEHKRTADGQPACSGRGGWQCHHHRQGASIDSRSVRGGGIPVIKEANGDLASVEAVIDKDFASSLLARDMRADLLLISTGVEKVAINYNTPQQKWLDRPRAGRGDGDANSRALMHR